MSVSYQIDPETQRIHTRCSGDVSFAEVMQHFRELAVEPERPARLDVLLDLTQTLSIPSSDQLGSVAEQVGKLGDEIRWGACAIVASRDVLFGMGRVFRAFVDDQFEHSSVFRELEEAELWLDSLRASRP